MAVFKVYFTINGKIHDMDLNLSKDSDFHEVAMELFNIFKGTLDEIKILSIYKMVKMEPTW